MRYWLCYFILFALVVTLFWGALHQNIEYAKSIAWTDWCMATGYGNQVQYVIDVSSGRLIDYGEPDLTTRRTFFAGYYNGLSRDNHYTIQYDYTLPWEMQGDIYLVDQVTQERVFLHQAQRDSGGDGYDNYVIEWTADSTYLAMGRHNGVNETHSDFVIFKTDGTFQQEIGGNIKVFKWSPDSRTLAYVSVDLATNQYQLNLWRRDTGQITNYPIYLATELSWSPDGKYLAYRNPVDPNQIDSSANFIVLNQQFETIYTYPIVGNFFWLDYKWSPDSRYLVLDYTLNANTPQRKYSLDLIDIETPTSHNLLNTATLPFLQYNHIARWGATGIGFVDMENEKAVWKAYYPDSGQYQTLATITERPIFVFDFAKSVGVFRFNDHLFAMSADQANPVTIHDGTIPIIKDEAILGGHMDLPLSYDYEKTILFIPYYANHRTYLTYIPFDGTFDFKQHTFEFDFPTLVKFWEGNGYVEGIDDQGHSHIAFIDENNLQIYWSLTTPHHFEYNNAPDIERGFLFSLDSSAYLYDFVAQKLIPLPQYITQLGTYYTVSPRQKSAYAIATREFTLYGNGRVYQFPHIQWVEYMEWSPDGGFLAITYYDWNNQVYTSAFNLNGEEVSRVPQISIAMGEGKWRNWIKCSTIATIPQRGRLSPHSFKLED
jgi:hypothetical protein